MTTHKTCKKIARLIYLTDDELNTREALSLSMHLEGCQSCKKIREDFLSTRQKTIQNQKDLPEQPDCIHSTEILIKSRSDFRIAQSARQDHPWNKTLSIIRYSSTIAAVFLLCLFIWEQTISVKKISALENRIQSTIIPSEPGFLDKLTLTSSTFTDKQWSSLALNLDISRKELNPVDLPKIKKLLESRIQSGKTTELALAGIFRNSMIFKRNTLTFKNLIK